MDNDCRFDGIGFCGWCAFWRPIVPNGPEMLAMGEHAEMCATYAGQCEVRP